MTPEREAMIREVWARVETVAEAQMRHTDPVFHADVAPFAKSWDPLAEIPPTTEIVTFIHKVEAIPGDRWRIVCEGVVVKEGLLQDGLSRLLRGETFLVARAPSGLDS